MFEFLRISEKDVKINVISSTDNFNKITNFSRPELKMSNYCTISFKSAVQGFHFYWTCWQPQENEIVNWFHEPNNSFDMFAIQFCQFETNNRAGHLLMEISRITKFLLDRRAVFQVKLTSNHYRRSPIVKGGLEMFCVVTIKIAKSAFKCLC